MNKYWEVRMKGDRVGELLLYGTIASAKFWGDEVTPKQIDADLKALGELDTLNVHINSGGGSVFAGMAIYSIVKRHSAATKCAYIDGLAASMASIIPLACDRVIMPGNALIMIHKPLGGVMGNAEDLRKYADLLDKIEDQALDIYEEKSHLARDKVKDMLAEETWMTAQEALESGFIDEIENEVQIAASIDGDLLICGDLKVNMKDFKNPAKLQEMYREAVKPPEPVADNNTNDVTYPPGLPDVLAEQAQNFHRLKDKIYKIYEED